MMVAKVMRKYETVTWWIVYYENDKMHYCYISEDLEFFLKALPAIKKAIEKELLQKKEVKEVKHVPNTTR